MNDLGTGTPQTEAASAIAKRSAARDALLDLKARIGKSVLGQGHLLLEAMEERQVTVAGKTYKMPDLFLVLATENPIEQEGTYHTDAEREYAYDRQSKVGKLDKRWDEAKAKDWTVVKQDWKETFPTER
jgi:hypothetical protein